jgi:purine-nucleoside phosphorylase
MAAGLSDEKLTHAHTKAMAPLGAEKLEQVLRRYLQSLSSVTSSASP